METKSADQRLAQSLRGYINRFSHVVINVSDLERSVEFYENTFPVRRHKRIDGPVQAYPSLGIERGQFKGWVLRNKVEVSSPLARAAEFPSREIHLIQWISPTPSGAPYREANHTGIYRQNAMVGDLHASYQNVVSNGGLPYGKPSWIRLSPDGAGVSAFAFRDPDGVTLEMMGPEEPNVSFPGFVDHCNINCRDLSASYKFYRDTIGLDLVKYVMPNELQPASNGSLGDSLRNPDGSEYLDGQMLFEAVLMCFRTDSRSPLDILEWDVPKPYGKAYESPTNLGIARVAIEVDDLESACARLQQNGYTDVGSIDAWDMGEFGERRVTVFRDPDGIMIELIEQVKARLQEPT